VVGSLGKGFADGWGESGFGQVVEARLGSLLLGRGCGGG